MYEVADHHHRWPPVSGANHYGIMPRNWNKLTGTRHNWGWNKGIRSHMLLITQGLVHRAVYLQMKILACACMKKRGSHKTPKAVGWCRMTSLWLSGPSQEWKLTINAWQTPAWANRIRVKEESIFCLEASSPKWINASQPRQTNDLSLDPPYFQQPTTNLSKQSHLCKLNYLCCQLLAKSWKSGSSFWQGSNQLGQNKTTQVLRDLSFCASGPMILVRKNTGHD